MRWAIVRLICLRELRDQLRDRRTMFVMVVLPLLLYPLGGVALMQITLGTPPRPSVLGISGAEHLPQAGSVYPSLLDGSGSQLLGGHLLQLGVEKLPSADRAPLDRGRVDLILVIPPDFEKRLASRQVPELRILTRPGDDSRLALQRTLAVLELWGTALKKVRFVQERLPPDFDRAFRLDLDNPPQTLKPPMEQILDLLTRVFPFILVLWSLAGALYPAVDLCAGEKERGTMETLLISPAQREEIVWGKFLTIWIFSAITALLNLLSMTATSWVFSSKLGAATVNVPAILWSMVLLLPLSAFFSALCLAVGAYARSTKEGQYYLMPLFVITMPLVFLTLVPGVTLNPFYSMIPVTGVSLLLQKLIQVESPDLVIWLYFVPVLVPMVIYSWMALRWAIIQFQKEEVLFREAERLDLGLWVRRLLREREPRPSAGQAMFCFVVVLGLSWFSLGLGRELLATNVIRFLAFVATPTLLMAFLLTSQPRQSLAVRVPPVWAWLVALVLVVLLTPPLTELTLFLLRIDPDLKKRLTELIEQYRPFLEWRSLQPDASGGGLLAWQALVVFAFLPAVCEELTFRGFILTGLQRRFRPRTAVLISSFLFCVMQMNVFQFVPSFILGVVLAYLTTRCGSILPSMLFSVLHRTALMAPVLFWPQESGRYLLGLTEAELHLAAGICTPLACLLLWWLTTHHPHPAYVTFLESDPGMERRR